MKHLAEQPKTAKAHRKARIIVPLAVLLVIVGAIAAYAALRDTAGTVTESLAAAEVTCALNADYSVTNTGDIPAYIRVRVVVNRASDDEIIPGDVPGYTVGSDWTRIGSYLYYNGILTEADGDHDTTTAVIAITPEDDTQVAIIPEAIQAAADAVDEWGVTYSGGSWS